MSCFPCFRLSKTNKLVKQLDDVATSTVAIPPSTTATTLLPADKHKLDRPPTKAPSKTTSKIPSKIVQGKKQRTSSRTRSVKLPGSVSITARTFTFSEIASATRNFKAEHLLGEGGFGPVYKGWLEDGKVVAVKQLDLHGRQGNQEFLVEVLMLRLLHHPNLVNLIGFCSEGDQRILVYEYMPLGSLENHLHHLKAGKEPLDWNTRLRIAEGAAKGLQYLHEGANPPVIYRDLKSSNILLDEGFHPKLSDFGLAKLGPVGDISHVSTRVMGTYGYCAPEYAMTGKLSQKSDIYSFGVVLLELLTGQKPFDETRPKGKQSLVTWARPYLFDRNKKIEIVDPWLIERAPKRSLLRALAVAEACLNDQPDHRAPAGDVVNALVWIRNSRSNASDSAKNSIERPADREKAVAEARLWAENVKASKKQQREQI